jgi:hypothetical protein
VLFGAALTAAVHLAGGNDPHSREFGWAAVATAGSIGGLLWCVLAFTPWPNRFLFRRLIRDDLIGLNASTERSIDRLEKSLAGAPPASVSASQVAKPVTEPVAAEAVTPREARGFRRPDPKRVGLVGALVIGPGLVAWAGRHFRRRV